jgi:homoserine O-acetyltransferase/O-succinyltransferase
MSTAYRLPNVQYQHGTGSHRPIELRVGMNEAVTAHPTAGVGIIQTQDMTWETPLSLQSGAMLAPFTLAYETYGVLNERRDNAVLVLHALSGDAHVAGRYHPHDRKPGWWDRMVGPGRALDTSRYFVICANVLGGCRGSTGPSSINPATNRPYGLDFPMVTIPDMVAAQMRLLDCLGIDTLRAAIGGSMGGMQVLQLAIAYPERVRLAIPLATAARHGAQQIAFNHIGREAIMRDPNWCGGDYYGHQPPAAGLAIARMLGHMSYLSEERLQRRFGRTLQTAHTYTYEVENEFAVESYLNYQGQSFVERFDANSYLYITKALDYFDASDGYPSLVDAFKRTQAHFLVISFSSDWLYPVHESEALVAALRLADRKVDYVEIESPLGHDAFLLEDEALTPIVADALASV